MNKGFTLIELLAVIVILAIILVVAVPRVLKVVDDSRENIYKSNEELLASAAKNYVMLNSNMLPTTNSSITITLSDLVSTGFIKSIKDLKNKTSDCEGHVLIANIEDNFKYIPFMKCENYISNNVINDGLILDIPLGDHMSGNTFLNKIGSNNGTNYGSTLASNRFGVSNKSSYLDGISNYILMPSINLSNVTITFWRKSADSTQWLLFGGQNSGFYLMAISGANFYHAAVGTNVKIYEDGLLVLRDKRDGVWRHYVATGVNLSTWTTIQINNYAGWHYKGYIDDIKIYNRSLSEQEVKHNYEVEKNIGE